jgi:hypothetical protein
MDVDGGFKRWFKFQRDVITSGATQFIDWAAPICIVLGGSVAAVLTRLSWPVALAGVLAGALWFYAAGAYRVWNQAVRRADAAELAAEQATATSQAKVTKTLQDFQFAGDSQIDVRSSADMLASGGGATDNARLNVTHLPGQPEAFSLRRPTQPES